MFFLNTVTQILFSVRFVYYVENRNRDTDGFRTIFLFASVSCISVFLHLPMFQGAKGGQVLWGSHWSCQTLQHPCQRVGSLSLRRARASVARSREKNRNGDAGATAKFIVVTCTELYCSFVRWKIPDENIDLRYYCLQE